jgi:8-oxo-dGTP pyrophosphatase MutT (NUDIX family)
MAQSHPVVSAAGILLMTRPTPSGVATNRPLDPSTQDGGDQDDCGRRFLLMRHPDRWDLPKGHAEPGETPRQTALRETEEETGIDASRITLDDAFAYSITYPVKYRDRGDRVFEKRVTFFIGYVDKPWPITCTEHLGCEWLRWDPPHRIQAQTIDPLLAAVETYLGTTDRTDQR